MPNRPTDPLKDTQRMFASALRHQQNNVRDLIATGPFPAEQLLQIYQNNFIISLTDALAQCYPCCQKVVGEEYFAELARRHIQNTPLTAGDINQYGAGFDSLITRQPELQEAAPYLKDLASLEWAIDRARQYAPAGGSFPFDQLLNVTEENLKSLYFDVDPSLQLINSQFPIVNLWHMITEDNVEPIKLEHPESAVVRHRQDGISVFAISRSAADLLEVCRAGLPLARAEEAALPLLSELVSHFCFTSIHGFDEENNAENPDSDR